MSFDSREKSQYQGQPIEAFKFTQGDNIWLWTSADRDLVLPAGTFESTVIKRKEMEFSQEDTGETMEFLVPRDNPVAELFIGSLPSTPISVTVYRAHREDEDLAITIFSGRVEFGRFEESECTLTASSLLSLMNRSIPSLNLQLQCNHALFSEGCRVNPSTARDSVVIDSVNGSSVVSSDFALRASGWFEAGRIETSEGLMGFIVKHIGDTIQLLTSIPGLAAGQTIWAYWGCDHLEGTCENKFGNLANHLGWSRLPNKNPFDGRID